MIRLFTGTGHIKSGRLYLRQLQGLPLSIHGYISNLANKDFILLYYSERKTWHHFFKYELNPNFTFQGQLLVETDKVQPRRFLKIDVELVS